MIRHFIDVMRFMIRKIGAERTTPDSIPSACGPRSPPFREFPTTCHPQLPVFSLHKVRYNATSYNATSYVELLRGIEQWIAFVILRFQYGDLCPSER